MYVTVLKVRLLLLIINNIFIIKIHILILIVKLKNKYALKNEYIFITEKSAVKPEKVKNLKALTVTEKVNLRECITLFDLSEIRSTWACTNLHCRSTSKYCVVDPADGTYLPLLESDINYWAKERYDDPELIIDPVPERILTHLYQKASNKTAQRQRTGPSPTPVSSTPSIAFNFPSWMAGMTFPPY